MAGRSINENDEKRKLLILGMTEKDVRERDKEPSNITAGPCNNINY